ncbi:copper resistance protein CopC [Streptomyces sp. ACA25]|uniref:copper resistance CopC/CopD family protein n=1 Tax=Streptomyces sp. ACA25 TaxID=3022596 RepID=UPI002306EA33|nr:copper resistance protein CopC [Streptomyces sp. ACA25]MDB1086187.1 copper resistance protein CopC [Streptomyces sp. ACA25]
MSAAVSSSPTSRSLWTVLLLTGATLATLLLAAAPAAAHASLTGSNPEEGAVVDTAPQHVVLTFSEEVAVSDDSLRVLDPTGERADTGELTDHSSDGVVRHGVPLQGGLPHGTYTVAWQIVSTDSHPVAGAFTFSIGAPSETAVDLGGDGGGMVEFLYDLGRYAAYGGFLLLVGGSAFVLLCRPGGAALPGVQRLVLAGWTTLTASTLVLLLLRHPYTSGGPLSDALDRSGLGSVIDTPTGTALVSRLLLLAAAGLFLAVLFGAHARLRVHRGEPGGGPAGQDEPGSGRDDERLRDLTYGLAIGGSILAVGLAATWAMAEHASSGPLTGLAIPSHLVHLLAFACWFGGLAALLLLLHRGPAVDREVVRRFSAVAFTSVVALTVTGLFQSWRQVGSWSALTGTAYGQLLLAKAGLIAVLLAAAWISRRWTALLADQPSEAAEEPGPPPAPAPEPALVAGGPVDPERAAQLARQERTVADVRRRRTRDADGERRGLRRSVLAEALIAVLVLAVTTALTGTTPARTEAAAPGPAAGGPAAEEDDWGNPVSLSLPYDTGGPDGRGRVLVDLLPARAGENTVHIRTVDDDGVELPAEELQLAFTLPGEDLGPLRFEPALVDAGHWAAEDITLPRPGDWELTLSIRTGAIHRASVTDTVPID